MIVKLQTLRRFVSSSRRDAVREWNRYFIPWDGLNADHFQYFVMVSVPVFTADRAVSRTSAGDSVILRIRDSSGFWVLLLVSGDTRH